MARVRRERSNGAETPPLVALGGREMSNEGERVYDPRLGKVLTRLKKTAPQIKQECEEKDRCVRYAEEILRQVSTSES